MFDLEISAALRLASDKQLQVQVLYLYRADQLAL